LGWQCRLDTKYCTGSTMDARLRGHDENG